jgi:hypothetical protein
LAIRQPFRTERQTQAENELGKGVKGCTFFRPLSQVPCFVLVVARPVYIITIIIIAGAVQVVVVVVILAVIVFLPKVFVDISIQ